jgi:hypothetical protein
MSTAATAAALIIEVRQTEKFYAQPDGTRVQVIAPTDRDAGDFYRDAQHRKRVVPADRISKFREPAGYRRFAVSVAERCDHSDRSHLLS